MSVRRALTMVGMGIAALLLILVGFTTWYTVDESEQAVIVTFGQANSTMTDSGLHFKLPWPIQSAEILSKETFSLKFGYEQEEGGDIIDFDPETKMITGDEYIVLTVIGSSTIDSALTDGKAEIEGKTRDLLATLIEKYDIGIIIQGVKLQDVELPNAEVRAAFTAVTDARETKNTKINEAKKYENQKSSEVIKHHVLKKRVEMSLYLIISMGNIKTIKKSHANDLYLKL